MIRYSCPSCLAHFTVADGNVGQKVSCPTCAAGVRLSVEPAIPATTGETKLEGPWWQTVTDTKPLRHVTYLHHSRDRDADVVMFFADPNGKDRQAVQQSSPVTGIRRLSTAVLDQGGRGNLCRYLAATGNTNYEVSIPKEKADYLAMELGIALE